MSFYFKSFRFNMEVDLGELLSIIRKRREWSLRRLANECGVSHSTIHRIEKGDYEHTEISSIARIFSALGFTLELRLFPIEEEE